MIRRSWRIFAVKVVLGGIPTLQTCVAKSSRWKALRRLYVHTGKTLKSNQ